MRKDLYKTQLAIARSKRDAWIAATTAWAQGEYNMYETLLTGDPATPDSVRVKGVADTMSKGLGDVARLCENDWGELFDVEFFERGLKKVVWVRNWTADREKYKGPTVLRGVDPRPPRDQGGGHGRGRGGSAVHVGGGGVHASRWSRGPG